MSASKSKSASPKFGPNTKGLVVNGKFIQLSTNQMIAVLCSIELHAERDSNFVDRTWDELGPVIKSVSARLQEIEPDWSVVR